jgi:hypothetical protein
MIVAPRKNRGALELIPEGFNIRYAYLESFKTLSQAIHRARNMGVKCKTYEQCGIHLIDKHGTEYFNVTDEDVIMTILRDGED